MNPQAIIEDAAYEPLMPEIGSLELARTYATLAQAYVQLWREGRATVRHEDALFIWIPKNAGTSVVTVLREHGLVPMVSTRQIRLCFRGSGRVTFGHMSLQALMDVGLVSREFVDRSFKFVITRNPYDRAVSLFRYLTPIVFRNWRVQPSFTDFLELLTNGYYDKVGLYNSLTLSQCNPQHDWIRDPKPDMVYQIENLEFLAVDLAMRWHIPAIDIPHANRSPAGSAQTLSRTDRKLIEQVYAADFDELGYMRA